MAARHVEMVQDLLELMGLGAERVTMVYCSSAEGRYFADMARKMSEKLMDLGPNLLKTRKVNEPVAESRQAPGDPPR